LTGVRIKERRHGGERRCVGRRHRRGHSGLGLDRCRWRSRSRLGFCRSRRAVAANQDGTALKWESPRSGDGIVGKAAPITAATLHFPEFEFSTIDDQTGARQSCTCKLSLHADRQLSSDKRQGRRPTAANAAYKTRLKWRFSGTTGPIVRHRVLPDRHPVRVCDRHHSCASHAYFLRMSAAHRAVRRRRHSADASSCDLVCQTFVGQE
jgi:hypothetical protein